MDEDFNKRKGVLLNINPGYWGEKLESIGTNAGYEEFDREVFAARVREYFDAYMAEDIEDDDLKKELWEDITGQVLSRSHDGEYLAYDAVHNYIFNSDDGEKFQFTDFFDSGPTDRYTFHYIWNLYAIVWGIMKYDDQKKALACSEVS